MPSSKRRKGQRRQSHNAVASHDIPDTQLSPPTVEAFGLHQDHHIYEYRIAITIGGNGNKTMTFAKNHNAKTKESECLVTLKVGHGSIVAMPRQVAGVEITSDGVEIWHMVNKILKTICFGVHYKKVNGRAGQPSEIVGCDWNEGEEVISFETVEDVAVEDAAVEDAAVEEEDAAMEDAAVEEEDAAVEEAETKSEKMFNYCMERVVKEESNEGYEDFLKYLCNLGLIIMEYKWNDSELNKALMSAMEKDELFVEDHKAKKGKCAWWATGGQAFSSRTIQILGKYKVFRDFLEWLRNDLFIGGELCGFFMAYYDEDAECDPTEDLDELGWELNRI